MKSDIAVIDDDEVYKTIIKKFIERSQAFGEAYFYTRPQDALDNFVSKAVLPRVILLDINMPLMDGWQFLRSLQEEFPDLYTQSKVYIVTSSIAYSDKEKINEFPGIRGFLSKPLKVATLKEIAAD
ncbi:response regulator [Gramella sp. GC03-9]|uniref:Response regulator n=1 Tax=Christiangramia oceanisediminis TaxID=2920386 RepID=A0A9X2HZU8_9FLAO|nr:response regulator [Gramella oceanisediminis]MCP9198694.1 response regulator [Gramella oceanisediminis]